MSLPGNIIKKINEWIPGYPEKRAVLIPALHLIQQEYRYVPEKSMRELAEILEIPFIEVRRVTSFYTMFGFEAAGRHRVSVCRTLSCHLNGSDELLKSLQARFNIGIGETTRDEKFTLLTSECLAACDRGPSMLVDDKLYTNLDKDKAIDILEELS